MSIDLDTIDTTPLMTDDELAAADRGNSPLDNAGKPDDKGDDTEVAGDKLDDDDESPDEKAEREAAEAEETKKRRTRIPLSRHEEILHKARQREEALLGELEKLKGGQQAAATRTAVSDMKAKINELQDSYEDLILDGKKDEARAARKQVEALREELSDYQTSVKTDGARRAAIDELTYNAKLASFESQYPELNPEHGGFDEEATNEVAQLLGVFVQTGMARAAALAKAVKYVLGAPAKADGSAAAATAAERAAAARRKAADADKRQAPNPGKAGLDSDKLGGGDANIDVMRLSQEKFAKIDEDALAKLRGDTV